MIMKMKKKHIIVPSLFEDFFASLKNIFENCLKIKITLNLKYTQHFKNAAIFNRFQIVSVIVEMVGISHLNNCVPFVDFCRMI